MYLFHHNASLQIIERCCSCLGFDDCHLMEVLKSLHSSKTFPDSEICCPAASCRNKLFPTADRVSIDSAVLWAPSLLISQFGPCHEVFHEWSIPLGVLIFKSRWQNMVKSLFIFRCRMISHSSGFCQRLEISPRNRSQRRYLCSSSLPLVWVRKQFNIREFLESLNLSNYTANFKFVIRFTANKKSEANASHLYIVHCLSSLMHVSVLCRVI